MVLSGKNILRFVHVSSLLLCTMHLIACICGGTNFCGAEAAFVSPLSPSQLRVSDQGPLTNRHHQTSTSRPIGPNDRCTSTSSVHMSSGGEEEDTKAKDLLDKVSKIRAEIAALENKSIEEVEAEARAKKTREEERRVAASAAAAETSSKSTRNVWGGNDGSTLSLPEDSQSQILLAAAAVERAFADGVTRQTVRFALVPEGDAMAEMQEWPGGAQQMYREAARPLTEALLREIRAETVADEKGKMAGLAPKVSTQDVWDFDGSALVTAESSSGPGGDVQALVLPNTDVKYTRDIDEIDGVMKERLLLLVNPFWRNLESWGINILSPGAKSKAQKVIFDRGYDETYALNRLSVRGETCAALKVYPHDWQMFAFIEDEYYPNREIPIRLGSAVEEPTSSQFMELLNERPEFKMTKNMRQMQRMMKR